jgi:hypothetical protein
MNILSCKQFHSVQILFRKESVYSRDVIAQLVQFWATAWTIGVLGFDSP